MKKMFFLFSARTVSAITTNLHRCPGDKRVQSYLDLNRAAGSQKQYTLIKFSIFAN